MEPNINPSLLSAELTPRGVGTVLASPSELPAVDVTAHVDGGDGASTLQRVRVSERSDARGPTRAGYLASLDRYVQDDIRMGRP
ncbi:hypothetical protein [Streptomyces sp. NPDC056361]|uniref:hypothetical protein n=1 Tax=Streptomyces sp. NPDC056361 TaxID=3345795 RepID=UPI0035E2A892